MPTFLVQKELVNVNVKKIPFAMLLHQKFVNPMNLIMCNYQRDNSGSSYFKENMEQW